MSLTHTRLGAFWMKCCSNRLLHSSSGLFFGYTGALVDIFWQHHRLHETVHSPDTAMNVIITFKNIGYFICAESFLGFSINM